MTPKTYTLEQENQIKHLLKERSEASRDEQKKIRRRLRTDFDFHISKYWYGFSDADFDDEIKAGRIIISNVKPICNSNVSSPTKTRAPKISDMTTRANIKTSFDPVADNDTSILILGSLPGDESLKHGEYYKNPMNRFWKVISAITNNEIPTTYSDKKTLLLRYKIGVWDVAHNAIRPGSLDSDIRGEESNDLNGFISNHKTLRVIAFNGQKPEKLYDKYFNRLPGIEYVSLPSTSPANAAFSLDRLIGEWRQIFMGAGI